MLQTTRTLLVTADSAADNLITLPAPPRGVINRLIVKQIGGTMAGFTVDLYDRTDAVPGESEVTGDPPRRDSDVHKLMAQQVVANLGTITAQYGIQLAYQNNDHVSTGRRVATGAIYMNLRPSGTAEKTFHIAYTISAPGSM